LKSASRGVSMGLGVRVDLQTLNAQGQAQA
jgi:hypothetical protein